MCPRIRLTQTNGCRAIIPIDAISCISENKREKCVEVYTMDGFWYSVSNPILEIDKKIDDAITIVNGGVVATKQQSPVEHANNTPTNNAEVKKDNSDGERYDNAKVAKFKRKRMLSAGIDKPARREAQIMEKPEHPEPNSQKENDAEDK